MYHQRLSWCGVLLGILGTGLRFGVLVGWAAKAWAA